MLRRERHADARLDMQLVADDLVRPADGLQETVGEVVGELLAVDADLQDRELVAAQASDNVAGAQAALETRRDALQQAVADEVPVLVVDFLEMIEVDPMQREALARIVALELAFQLLAEMEAVRDLGQRVVARQPFDLLVRLALRGDVLLHVDPTAAAERPIGDTDHAAIGQVLDFLAAAALLEQREMLLDPGRDAAVGGALARGAARMVAQDVGECRAGPRQLLGQQVDARISLVADDEALVGVEHRQPAPHVIERGFEACVELLEPLIAMQRLDELLLEADGSRRRSMLAAALRLRGSSLRATGHVSSP